MELLSKTKKIEKLFLVMNLLFLSSYAEAGKPSDLDIAKKYTRAQCNAMADTFEQLFRKSKNPGSLGLLRKEEPKLYQQICDLARKKYLLIETYRCAFEDVNGTNNPFYQMKYRVLQLCN